MLPLCASFSLYSLSFVLLLFTSSNWTRDLVRLRPGPRLPRNTDSLARQNSEQSVRQSVPLPLRQPSTRPRPSVSHRSHLPRVCSRYQFERDLLPPPTPVGEAEESRTHSFVPIILPLAVVIITATRRLIPSSNAAPCVESLPEPSTSEEPSFLELLYEHGRLDLRRDSVPRDRLRDIAREERTLRGAPPRVQRPLPTLWDLALATTPTGAWDGHT